MNDKSRKIKLQIIAALALIIIVWLFYWVATHGFVVVQQNNNDGQTEIIVTNSQGETKTVSPGSRTLLGAGDYQVSVSGDQKSHFESFKVNGFFRSTTVEVELSEESARKFVGNNPSPCMQYFNLLVSSSCHGSIESLQVHTAATGSTPTLTNKLAGLDFAGFTVKDYIPTNSRLYVLASLSVDGGTTVGLFPVSKNTQRLESDGFILSEHLPSDNNYKGTPYNDGFVIYSEDGDEILFFDSPSDTNPQRISTPSYGEGVNFQSLNNYNGSLLTLSTTGVNYDDAIGSSYSPSYIPGEEHGEGHGEETPSVSSPRSEINIINENNIRTVDFNFAVHQAVLCASNKLCVLKEGGELQVYNIETEDPELLYSLSSIVQIEQTSSSTVFVDSYGVIKFNPEDSSGHYQYTFSDYSFCGIKPLAQSDDYLVCIKHPSINLSSALLIQSDSSVGEPAIDKAVLGLSQVEEVKSLSPYGNFIHISPELGELEFDRSSGVYLPNPQRLKQNNQAIANAVKSLGLSDSKYKIVNPYSN